MTGSDPNLYGRGVLLSFAGMLVISPDGLILRLIADAGTLDIVFYRSLFMGISLTVILAALTRTNPVTAWRRMGRLGWLSGLLMGVANLLFVAAITNTSVANTLVILAIMPLFGAALGWLLLREAIRLRTWAAILVALAGIAVLLSGSLGGGTWQGDLFALGCAFLHALNLVVLRRAGAAIILPSLALSGFVAALLAQPFADPLTVTGHDLGWIAFSGLVQLPLALSLFLSGTRYIPAAEVALFSLVETVLGPLWAWIGVGEVPHRAALIGAGIVIVAILGNAALGLRQPRLAQP